eukprot:4045905-Prymnesium_polylepis.1
MRGGRTTQGQALSCPLPFAPRPALRLCSAGTGASAHRGRRCHRRTCLLEKRFHRRGHADRAQ